MGGTCGSVHVQTFNSNLKELGAVLCSYFAQRMGTKNDGCGQKSEGEKSSKDWKDLNDNWGKEVARNMDRKVWVDSVSEQVDVGRLKQNEKARGWQPESSMRGSRWCRAPIAALQN